jgi:hypothetical protein
MYYIFGEGMLRALIATNNVLEGCARDALGGRLTPPSSHILDLTGRYLASDLLQNQAAGNLPSFWLQEPTLRRQRNKGGTAAG